MSIRRTQSPLNTRINSTAYVYDYAQYYGTITYYNGAKYHDLRPGYLHPAIASNEASKKLRSPMRMHATLSASETSESEYE